MGSGTLFADHPYGILYVSYSLLSLNCKKVKSFTRKRQAAKEEN